MLVRYTYLPGICVTLAAEDVTLFRFSRMLFDGACRRIEHETQGRIQPSLESNSITAEKGHDPRRSASRATAFAP